MFRFVARLLGYFCLAGGFVSLVIDATRSIASGIWLYNGLADGIALIEPALRDRGAAGVPGWTVAFLHAIAAGPLRDLPVALILLALSLILLRLGRRREPEIGFSTR